MKNFIPVLMLAAFFSICVNRFLFHSFVSESIIQDSICDNYISPSTELPSLEELGINLDTVWNDSYTIDDQIEDALVNGFFENRYTLGWYGCHGDCDYIAIYNVMQIASDSLWAESIEEGKTYHVPCGGASDCDAPYLTENVRCYVEKTNCDFGEKDGKYHDPEVMKTYILDCRGDVICENPKDCCLVVKTVNGPRIARY